ncbi:MAG: phosphatase PAP2 family protein [Elusimicrobiaceae bacterium]|nr:phosphatase PAP2 family protein [Elusimicrobiaceae bacterium]
MDINYLLWLQEFRIETENVLTPFMKWLSSFSVSYLLLLPILIYWCWDKRRGLLTLFSLYLCAVLTAVIKLTACVYRPWVKDPRIIPAVKSLPTSYSFPSRHTIMGMSLYIGSATVFWQKKIN